MNLPSTPPGETYRFGHCALHIDTRELLRQGQAQKVERRTFDLIHYLLRQQGRVVGKDELLDQVWRNRFLGDAVIAQTVMKARKALGCTGRADGPIRTVHRVGYRFTGEVQHETGAPAGGGLTAVPVVHWLAADTDAALQGQVWLKTGLIVLAAHWPGASGADGNADAGASE